MTKIDIKEVSKRIPGYVLKVADGLHKKGFEAYLVGGGAFEISFWKESQRTSTSLQMQDLKR